MCELLFESLASVLVIHTYVLQQVLSLFPSVLAVAFSALATDEAQGKTTVEQLQLEMVNTELSD